MVVEQTAELRHRGKLYALKENAVWEDRGTGYASVVWRGQGKHLVFKGEASDQVFHDRPVFGIDAYQLQGDEDKQSIIVWADSESELDWAISFQDPAGALMTFLLLGPEQGETGTPKSEAPCLLPAPELRSLAQLARMLNFVPPSQRDKTVGECMSPKFVEALRQVFRTAEDLGREEELILIWRIAKGIFLLSSPRLTERYLRHDVYEDIFGMLEYDDGLPRHKRVAHRLVLKVQVRYNKVLAFDDSEMAKMIHVNYRLQYLKDIVLPRLLDDATFASMTQMVQSNISSILGHLQKSDALMDELFKQLRTKDVQSLLFLQDACRSAKMLPPSQRQELYENMVKRDLFQTLTPFLQAERSQQDTTSAWNEASSSHHCVVEILLLSVLNDPSHLRRFFTPAAVAVLANSNSKDNSKPGGRELLTTLIASMHSESDQGVQGQIADIVRSVMDLAQLDANQRDAFLGDFYDTEGGMEQLTAPLRALEGKVQGVTSVANSSAAFGLQLVCELLAFATLHHGHRAKTFFTNHGLAQKASLLLEAPQRFLQLAPIRLVRAMVMTKDDAYHRLLSKSTIFGAALESLRECLRPPALGGSLMVSAIVELLETLRVQNVKKVVTLLCVQHCDLLKELAPLCKAVHMLLLHHNQNADKEAAPSERKGHATLRRRYSMTETAELSPAATGSCASRRGPRRSRAGGSTSDNSLGNFPTSKAGQPPQSSDNNNRSSCADQAVPFQASSVHEYSSQDSCGSSDGELQALPPTAFRDSSQVKASDSLPNVLGSLNEVCKEDELPPAVEVSSASLLSVVSQFEIIAASAGNIDGDDVKAISTAEMPNSGSLNILLTGSFRHLGLEGGQDNVSPAASGVGTCDYMPQLVLDCFVNGDQAVHITDESQRAKAAPEEQEESVPDSRPSNVNISLLSHAAKRARTGATILTPSPILA